MKKYFISSVMALAISAVFTGCSKSTEEVFEQNKAQIVEDTKTEYITNFIAKYGQVPSDQNWDFTQSGISTRALSEVDMASICSGVKDPKHFERNVTKEKTQLKAAIPNGTLKTWNPFISVCMYPVYCHDESKKNDYFKVVVKYNESESIQLFNIQIKNNSWWNNSSATAPANEGKAINTFPLELDPDVQNVSWSIEYTGKNSSGSVTIEDYKEVQLNGRTYWCFDYDGNKDYVDLIYVVAPNPAPLAKRYLIEDLGSKDDFDFNDIVVDVIQNDNGTQEAIIRAMGGTLDFTIQIGDATWTKSVQGVAKGFEVNKMYNTENFDPTYVIDRFTVTNWNPSTNNIKAFVKIQENTNVSGDVIVEIPFPREGEVPMIIAIKPIWDWQFERESLPEDWWSFPEE